MVTLNLSQVFVRYPDLVGVGQALEPYALARLRAAVEVPRLLAFSTDTPWIAVLAVGNNPPPELAQFLSRALEADAIWAAVAGRALAYRWQVWKLGRRAEESTVPKDLFDAPETRPLPEYPDAELDVDRRLDSAGVPGGHRFLFAEELGDAGDGRADGLVVEPGPERAEDLVSRSFAVRVPRRPAGLRTLFDRFDAERSVVEDEVLLRGQWDEGRGRRLLELLERMSARRTRPKGWTYRYVLESPEGMALLRPLLALHAGRKWSYELALTDKAAAR